VSESARAYDPRLVGLLSIGQMISWGSVFYLFAVLMVPIEDALEISRAQSSLAFSLGLLAEGCLAYPIGRLIDRGYERVVMTAGSVMLAVCLVLLSQVTSLVELYAVWIGLGFGMAATLYPPVFAVVTRRFPLGYRRAIITLTFLGGLASTVFIPLIAYLITLLGWRMAMWPLAALHLFVCVPLHWVLLRHAPKASQAPQAHNTPNTGQAPLATAPAQTSAVATQPLWHHLTSAPFLLVSVFIIVNMAMLAALPTHIVSLLRESGLAESWAIAIPASIGVIQVFGRLLLYFFEHHFDVHTANRWIPCLMPLGLAALLVAPSAGGAASIATLGLLFAFVVLWGAGNGMSTIVKGTAMAQYVSREHVASLNGALGIPIALARAAAPLALGLMWSDTVGYKYGLWLLLGLGVVGVAALVAAQRVTLQRA
jgi:MFS family permease